MMRRRSRRLHTQAVADALGRLPGRIGTRPADDPAGGRLAQFVGETGESDKVKLVPPITATHAVFCIRVAGEVGRLVTVWIVAFARTSLEHGENNEEPEEGFHDAQLAVTSVRHRRTGANERRFERTAAESRIARGEEERKIQGMEKGTARLTNRQPPRVTFTISDSSQLHESCTLRRIVTSAHSR